MLLRNYLQLCSAFCKEKLFALTHYIISRRIRKFFFGTVARNMAEIGTIRADSLIRYKNGLYFFSYPIVVSPIWPGKTAVSSGRVKSFSRMDRTCSDIEPVGRSVRPTDC